jgi:hypothetical protein
MFISIVPTMQQGRSQTSHRSWQAEMLYDVSGRASANKTCIFVLTDPYNKITVTSQYSMIIRAGTYRRLLWLALLARTHAEPCPI